MQSRWTHLTGWQDSRSVTRKAWTPLGWILSRTILASSPVFAHCSPQIHPCLYANVSDNLIITKVLWIRSPMTLLRLKVQSLLAACRKHRPCLYANVSIDPIITSGVDKMHRNYASFERAPGRGGHFLANHIVKQYRFRSTS